MAATEEEKRSAASHLSASIDTARRFPENVFRGEWHVFLFFDSDRILHLPEAIYSLHALLAAEGGSCAILEQLSERNDPGRGLLRRCIDRAEVPNPVSSLLYSPGDSPTRFLEDYGLASDGGRWCMYLEGQAELGVLAVRDQPLRSVLEPVMRLLETQTIEQAAKNPHCYALGAGKSFGHPVLRSFMDGLIRGYGDKARASPAVPRWAAHGEREGPSDSDVRLVPRTAEHAAVLFPLLKGTTVCDTLVWDGPESLESFLATYATPPGDPSHRHFTILGGGVPVGSLSIRPGFQPGRGDIGYWVGIPHQRKGYATAAVKESLRIAFGGMGMEKIEACAFVGNLGSRRVLEKCGFVQEGLTRRAVLKRGRWLDEWVFGITREDWLSR